jgi:phenylpropionate dioxygenase-like ring-hydroxylating dioxygenase large terminal subunit
MLETQREREQSGKPGTSFLGDPLLERQWFAVAWSREVLVGKPVAREVMGVEVVLWRSTDAVHCWRDLCIHRGAKLSLGQANGECLVCPYHAWEYDTLGQCVRIPAQPEVAPPLKAKAQTFEATERYGMVWVRFADASSVDAGGLPAFALGEDPDFRTMYAGPYRFRALGPRVIENFFDVAHLGIVHAGLLGEPGRVRIEDYEVVITPNGPEASDIHIWQPDPDGTSEPAMVNYRYWASGPLTAGLEKTHGMQRFGILLQVMPVDVEFCEARMVIAMNYGEEIPEAEIVAFQDKVAAQDKVIVESQRPELLPLDLREELHLRSDLMAIAYRKWLRKIGMSYGTA